MKNKQLWDFQWVSRPAPPTRRGTQDGKKVTDLFRQFCLITVPLRKYLRELPKQAKQAIQLCSLQHSLSILENWKIQKCKQATKKIRMPRYTSAAPNECVTHVKNGTEHWGSDWRGLRGLEAPTGLPLIPREPLKSSCRALGSHSAAHEPQTCRAVSTGGPETWHRRVLEGRQGQW